MLYKEIPFLRIVIPLCGGIIAGRIIKPGYSLIILLTLMFIFLLITGKASDRYTSNHIFGVALNIALITCGLLLYRNQKDSLSILIPEESEFLCTLSRYPEEKEKSTMLNVKLENRILDGKMVHINGSMLLYFRKDTLFNSYSPGDRLIINCTPSEITNRGNPSEFNYRFFMENRAIRYFSLVNTKNIILHTKPKHRCLRQKALIFRKSIVNIYKRNGIEGDRLAVLAAVTLGSKSMLDSDQKQDFATAGVIHIMAVSGLHVMILSIFIMNILCFLKRRYNIIRIFITLIIIWLFAFITGLAPSVMRASLMFTFLQAGTLLNRRANPVNSLLASAFVLIMLKPGVIFETSFLLSYAAVIYILIFYRDLYLKIHFKKAIPDRIWQLVVVTLVAQAGTLPLTITLFNRFPTYFILTNIIVVPLASILVVGGCLLLIINPVHIIAVPVVMVLNKVTDIISLITERTASLPYSSVENIGMIPVQTIFLTITIFLFGFYCLKKRTISVLYPLSFLFLFVITGSITGLVTQQTNELIVYNTPGSSEIGIRTGKILNLYTDISEIRPEIRKHCASLHLKMVYNRLSDGTNYLVVNGKKIIICSRPDIELINSFKPDFVIISSPEGSVTGSLSGIKSSTIVITPKASRGFRLPVNAWHLYRNNIFLVGKSGAFVKSI